MRRAPAHREEAKELADHEGLADGQGPLRAAVGARSRDIRLTGSMEVPQAAPVK